MDFDGRIDRLHRVRLAAGFLGGHDQADEIAQRRGGNRQRGRGRGVIVRDLEGVFLFVFTAGSAQLAGSVENRNSSALAMLA